MGGKSGGKRVGRGGKGGAEGIAYGLENVPVVVLDGLPQQFIMAGQSRCASLRDDCSQSLVLPSISVKRKVMFPVGIEGIDDIR